MASQNLQDDLNWLLIRASIVAKQRLLKLSEEHDLSLMQALTLCLLEPDKSVPMSAISDLLTCDPSNVTGIVERLSVGSFIERRESSVDRRVKTIKLTDSGIALRDKLLPKIAEDHASNLAKLNDAEIKELKKLLRKTLPETTKK